MPAEKIHFNNVSLLVTHYNRSKSLERLLKSFKEKNCSFAEIVISDDGSKSEHLDYINDLKGEYDFKLITTSKNSGLGNNINKGQDAVQSLYTLYIQEDFIPMDGFTKPLLDGVSILNENPEADYVRFYSYIDYPNVKPYKEGFSEMVFNIWATDTNRYHLYSDHPHLRRSSFFKKFGRYNETKHSDKIEFDMMISFLCNKGKGYLYNDYRKVFDQVNSNDEPSTVKRDYWRNSESGIVSLLRYFYRQYIFNYSYLLKKY